MRPAGPRLHVQPPHAVPRTTSAPPPPHVTRRSSAASSSSERTGVTGPRGASCAIQPTTCRSSASPPIHRIAPQGTAGLRKPFRRPHQSPAACDPQVIGLPVEPEHRTPQGSARHSADLIRAPPHVTRRSSASLHQANVRDPAGLRTGPTPQGPHTAHAIPPTPTKSERQSAGIRPPPGTAWVPEGLRTPRGGPRLGPAGPPPPSLATAGDPQVLRHPVDPPQGTRSRSSAAPSSHRRGPAGPPPPRRYTAAGPQATHTAAAAPAPPGGNPNPRAHAVQRLIRSGWGHLFIW